jgi:hypothetical protein
MHIRTFIPALFVLAACAVSPALVSYFVEPGVIQYFISPTDWKTQGSGARARLDITYRTNTGVPATVNISFFGEKTIPRHIASVALRGDGAEYPLRDIAILYPDPDRRELRITSAGDRDTLASLLKSQVITLAASIDGNEYCYVPDRHFIRVKERFITAISYEVEHD